MSKILLVNMPFSSLESPILGISLLKSGLTKEGILCEIRYLNFVFARFVGYEEYTWFTKNLAHRILAGEWLFSQYLFGERLGNRYIIEEVLKAEWGLDDSSTKRILRMKGMIGPFLAHCLDAIDWEEYLSSVLPPPSSRIFLQSPWPI